MSDVLVINQKNAGDTVRIAGTDTASTIDTLSSDALKVSGTGGEAGYTKNANAVLITCEDNDIRYAFSDIAPTQGASAVGHLLAVGDSLVVNDISTLQGMMFINKTAATTGVLQVTPFFLEEL